MGYRTATRYLRLHALGVAIRGAFVDSANRPDDGRMDGLAEVKRSMLIAMDRLEDQIMGMWRAMHDGSEAAKAHFLRQLMGSADPSAG